MPDSKQPQNTDVKENGGTDQFEARLQVLEKNMAQTQTTVNQNLEKLKDYVHLRVHDLLNGMNLITTRVEAAMMRVSVELRTSESKMADVKNVMLSVTEEIDSLKELTKKIVDLKEDVSRKLEELKVLGGGESGGQTSGGS